MKFLINDVSTVNVRVHHTEKGENLRASELKEECPSIISNGSIHFKTSAYEKKIILIDRKLEGHRSKKIKGLNGKSEAEDC